MIMTDQMFSVRYFYLIITFFLTVLFISQSSASENSIVLYQDIDYKGGSYNLTVDTCISPLPTGFDNVITSIETKHDKACVHVYKDLNCLGDFAVIKALSPRRFLGYWEGYNDAVSSIGPCGDPCDPMYIGVIEKNASTTAIIYDHSDYKGQSSKLHLKAGKCTVVPRKLKKKATSIRILADICIELYPEWDCTGESIQLRQNSASLNGLHEWGRNDNARSASFCGLHCNDRRLPGEPIGGEVVPKLNDSNFMVVTLYDDVDYKGDSKNIVFSSEDSSCIDIMNEWEGESRSINIHGGCFIIYEDQGCNRGFKNLKLDKSNEYAQKDLGRKGIEFEERVRSIETCSAFNSNNPTKPSTSKGLGGPSMGIGSASGSSSTLIIILVLASILIVGLVLAGIVTGMIRMKKTNERIMDILSDREIQEFISGLDNAAYVENISDGGEGAVALTMPYDHNYEIPKEMIKLDMHTILGSGQYAVVYKGQIKFPDSREMLVAVKTIKPHSEVDYVRALLKEIKVMIFVGKHPHVVDLVGCYTHNLQQGELLVMTNLYENGSLDKFLTNNRDSFVNLVEKGQLFLQKLHSEEYKNISFKLVDQARLGRFHTIHLIEWSYQIADGMEYLASKKIVHGDLATRNILLDFTFKAKISDFGLSKQLYEYTQYVMKKQAPLPWRWLAIESLKSLAFSTESDVWAFGVTMWEIFTLADVPYPGVVWGENFILNLMDGLRLPKPQQATSDIYNWMLSCWREKPRDRNSFAELKTQLNDLLLGTSISVTGKSVEYTSMF